jgi:hypothetical protein
MRRSPSRVVVPGDVPAVATPGTLVAGLAVLVAVDVGLDRWGRPDAVPESAGGD